MAKIFYDKNLNIDTPTIILKKRDFTNIGSLIASEIKYKNNFASANELSFKVYKFLDEKLNVIWDEINDYNVIYIPEYEEFFDIHVSLNEEIETYKVVTCTALAESELSNVNLYDIEINTEEDILRDDYDKDYPTIFYRDLSGYEVDSDMYKKLKNASLLHRILNKASNYEIGHVDESLKTLTEFYEFSISDTNIYDELIGEIAEQYKCLFIFEIKEDGTRLVHAYDLCNTCSTCGYRGEFYDECPECHSTDFSGAYGKDTTIFSSKENLATSSTIESNKDQLKNCFRVSGGDDMITSTVSLINPSGSNYYFYFSPETLASMPDDLRIKIESYSSESNKCLNNTAYVLNSTNVNNYNSVVQYINTRFPETDEEGNVVDKFSEIDSAITGYKNVTPIIYDAIDIYYYLQHSMMPTPELDNQSIDDALKLLTVNNLSPIAVSSPSSSGIDSIVNNAVIGMAKTLINTALYKVEVEKDKTTYTPGETTGEWKGVLKLTSIRNNEDTRKTSTLTLTVDGDKERYIKQKISRVLSRNDNVIRQITDIEMPLNEFKERIQYYSAVYLEDTANAFSECIEIINTSDIKELADNMKSLYQERIDLLGEVTEKDSDGNIVKASGGEISKRLQQITYITNIQTELDVIKSNVRSILDFEEYLGEYLWKVFCSYRREDIYQNSNYISDGLTNAKLMRRTQTLVDEAQKELYKAGNLQYNISSTLNNLLAIKEFHPLVEDFDCGNWIHVMIDEKLYNLRLLSYEIDYENLDKISVEFSTVTKIWSGVSDVKSILDSAQSIAGSYSSTISQVKQSTKASKYVNNWVDEGLSATTTKIVNNADNQDIVIDKTGILCRSYDDILGQYDPYQMKIISNGMYLYNTDENTIKTGIGKFIYLDPKNNFVEKVGYGVIADTVISNIILSKEVGIYNSDGSIILDNSGITIKDSNNNIVINADINGNAYFKGIITATDGEFTGKITANSGSIGNLVINTNKLTYGNFGIDTTASPTNVALWLGSSTASSAPFRVTYDGNMTATNAIITGTINATGGTFSNTITCNGTISGGTLSGSTISGGSIKIGQNFSVDVNGNLTANNANIVGSINSGSTITGARINGGSITIGSNFSVDTYGNLIGVNSKFVNSLLIQDSTGTNREFYIDGEQAIINVPFYTYISFICGKGIAYDIGVAKGCEAFVVNTAGNTHIGIHNPEFSYGSNMYLYGGGKELQIARWVIENSDEHFGVRPGSDGDVYLGSSNHKWSTIFSNKDTINTSDREKKREICPIDETLEKIYLETPTYTFYFNDGDRRHIGTISQEVEELIKKYELTSKEFAPFCKDLKIKEIYNEDGDVIRTEPDLDENGNYQYDYGFRYGEYTMFTVHMVQKLYKENETLKQRIEILEKAMS